jgi:DNA-binding protein Fis
MKKFALFLLVILITGTFMSTISYTAPTITVLVSGKRIVFPDAQPFIDSQGRTQTPARYIGEALGTTVSWDATARKATFEKSSKKLILYIDKKEYDLNGQKMKMDTAALIKNNRTFVPARYVAEAFGATVRWDSVIKTVYIELKPEATNGDKVVGGFKVPSDTEVIVTKIQLKDYVEAAFQLNFYRDDYERQKVDLKEMLLQQFESDLVDKIIAYVNRKKSEDDELPGKYFFSKKNSQYIKVQESRYADINIHVYIKGYKY